VYRHDTFTRVGIRSERFLFAPEAVLSAQSPRVMITGAALAALRDQRRENLSDDVARMLKTWLGFRYDRPAVPQEYLPLAKRIASELSKKKHKDIEPLMRCILMAFAAAHPPEVEIYAVIYDADATAKVEEWLNATLSLAISPDIGVVTRVEALTQDRVSLTVLERTYAADLSQLSIDRAGMTD